MKLIKAGSVYDIIIKELIEFRVLIHNSVVLLCQSSYSNHFCTKDHLNVGMGKYTPI